MKTSASHAPGITAAFGLLFLLAVLPLLWIDFRNTSIANVGGAVALLLSIGAVSAEVRHVHWRYVRSFYVVGLAFTVSLALFTWYWGADFGGPLRAAVYLTVAVVVMRLLTGATVDPRRYARSLRILRWAAPAALVSFLLNFYRSMASAGVSVASVFDALRSGDPTIIEYTVFRTTFNQSSTTGAASPDFIQSNLRHEVMAALALAAFVSLWCLLLRRWSRGFRTICVLSCLAIGVIVLLSLSRSLMLAVVLPAPLLLAARLLWRGRGSPTLWAWTLVFLPALMVGVLLTPYAGLAYDRLFVQTASYSERSASFGEAVTTLTNDAGAFAFGGQQLKGVESSHNIVLDAWSAAGIVGGLSALALFVVVLKRWSKLAAGFIASAKFDRPRLLLAAGGAVPLVRMLTTGGGLLHFVEWLLLGAFYAAGCGLDWREREQKTEAGGEFADRRKTQPAGARG